MDILGIHVGDNRHEAFNSLMFSRSVETGKNFFHINENIFGSFMFSITYYYAGDFIERITLSYNQSEKGVKGHTASIEEVFGRVCEYFDSNLGLPISMDKSERGGNAVWSDINITVGCFYQIRRGIDKYLGNYRETNCVVIQIEDFASHIKDDEFKRMFLQVRHNKRVGKVEQVKKNIAIKTKLTFQYSKYILLTILVLACLFIYAFSHRYQVVYNGRGIIDKWTGTVEEVKYKK